MENKKYVFALAIIFIIAVSTVSLASAYSGTGFTHNIGTSKYLDKSASDILNEYNDTECSVETEAICTKVVDGDTIYLDNGMKVRLVGVNTPEKGQQGARTSAYFVEKLCLNKKVGLDIDDKKNNDRYGRTLAVVIVDGKNVNEMLLKEGLAEIMYMPPSEFYPFNWGTNQTHVDTTHSSSTGNTVKSTTSTSSSAQASYVGNANTGKFHKASCGSVSDMSESNKVFFTSRDEATSQGYIACKRCNP